MEGFLDYLFMVLPALRVDMFIENARPAGSTQKAASFVTTESEASFELSYFKYNIKARAVLRDGEFGVEAGSEACPEWKGDSDSSYRALHEELLKSHALIVKDATKAVFVKDYVFSRTSAAAAVVCGQTSAGPRVWKLRDSKITCKQCEAQNLENAASSS